MSNTEQTHRWSDDERKELLQLAVEIADLGTWFYDVKSEILTIDERMCEILGTETRKLPLNRILECIHLEDLHQILPESGIIIPDDPATYKSLAECRKPVEFRIQSRGETHWISAIGRARLAGDGENQELLGLIGTAQDITARKQSESELLKITSERMREKRLHEAIISGTPDLVYAFDLDYRFIFANDALLEMWGKTFDEAINRNLLENGYEPWHAEMHEREIDQVIATKKPVRGEVAFPHATLGRRIYDYIFVPVLDDNGDVEAIAGTTRDITDRKMAEISLEERIAERTESLLSYQEELRELAAELSKAKERERQRLATELHDNLGQTLAVGKMRLNMLQESDDLPETAVADLADLADSMAEAILYTRELMSELKPPPSFEGEDLSTTIHWLAEKMQKHGLNVKVEDDNQVKLLSGEVCQALLQMTRELLFNVVKHSGVNHARVMLERMGPHVHVTVEDKGKGFSLKGRRPKPTREGGFGLFNVQERMFLLGGSLQILSEPENGSRVVLVAPLNRDAGSGSSVSAEEKITGGKSAQPVYSKSDKNVRIVLADDHQMVRTGLRMIIEEEDDLTVVAEASSGREAVSLAFKMNPDVIIMDVDMPGLNGIEATRQIISRKPEVRIIGLSFHGSGEVARAMRSAGASAYLTKSEVQEALCATIRSEARSLSFRQ